MIAIITKDKSVFERIESIFSSFTGDVEFKEIQDSKMLEGFLEEFVFDCVFIDEDFYFENRNESNPFFAKIFAESYTILVCRDPDKLDYLNLHSQGFNEIISKELPEYQLFAVYNNSKDRQSLNERPPKKEGNEIYFDSELQNYTKEIQCVLNHFGYVEYSNRACEDITGYSLDELKGKLIFNFLHSKNIFKLFKDIKFNRMQLQDFYLLDFIHKNGHIIYLNVQFKKIKYRGEDAIMFFAQDVSKLVATQKKLNLSNNRWQSLVTNTPLTIVITDLDLNIEYINKIDEYGKKAGITTENLRGVNFRDLAGSSSVNSSDEFESFISRMKKYGFADNYVAESSRSGSIYFITASILKESGKENGVLFIMQDITEREKIRRNLQNSEERNNQLFQNNISGTIRINSHGKILESNIAMQKILGLNNPSILVGESITSIMTEELWGKIKVAIDKRRNLENQEIHFSNNNNKFWLFLNATIIEVDGEVLLEISVKDISSLKDVIFKLERETDRSNEYQSRLLSSQLNPHFIFNALNSMQYYILNENIEEGLEFVSDFSGLIRMVLSNSNYNLIPLEEEVAFLEKYLVVEKHRMKGGLNYKLEIDPDLDIKNYAIPPMLIQPYVENTIVHGFTHKNSDGNVWLRFKSAENSLICEIEDDGVGREVAQNMKKSFTKDINSSMSMAINKNRLDLLGKQFNATFKILITDKYDSDQNATGTLVKIFIPRIDNN